MFTLTQSAGTRKTEVVWLRPQEILRRIRSRKVRDVYLTCTFGDHSTALVRVTKREARRAVPIFAPDVVVKCLTDGDSLAVIAD